MTPNEKADNARRILAEPVITAAFSDIRMNLVAKLEQAPIGDVDTQHEIALTLQLLKQLRSQLERYVQDQAVDQHRQKHDTFIEKMRQRIG
jgi:hypothetical protein